MAKTGRDYQVISADSHVVEPPDLWDVWLESKFRPNAPKLMKAPAGIHHQKHWHLSSLFFTQKAP